MSPNLTFGTPSIIWIIILLINLRPCGFCVCRADAGLLRVIGLHIWSIAKFFISVPTTVSFLLPQCLSILTNWFLFFWMVLLSLLLLTQGCQPLFVRLLGIEAVHHRYFAIILMAQYFRQWSCLGRQAMCRALFWAVIGSTDDLVCILMSLLSCGLSPFSSYQQCIFLRVSGALLEFNSC